MKRVSQILRYLHLCFLGGLFVRYSNKKTRNKKVFFTLTSTPSRISKLKPTILSLLDQTVPPDQIIINVPEISKKGEKYVIPRFLEKMRKVRINRVEEDLGPVTKLLPTLKLADIGSNDWIIVLDDDQVYPKKLIETYLKNARKFPEHAMTLCGWCIPPEKQHNRKGTRRGAGIKFKEPHPNIKEPTPVEIVQGASSYAVKKSYFTNDIFDYKGAPKAAFFADDIWTSGHLAKNKIPRVVIIGDFAFYRMHSIKHMGDTGLRYSVNADNKNNNDLYQYFDDYWELYN